MIKPIILDTYDISARGLDILVLSPTPTYPLDAGNRKRVFHVCNGLKQRGARIHFLYYPFEWWFTAVPQDHICEMEKQWDSFYLIPTTRPIQSAARGYHHEIDEWWDYSIEAMLRWLLQRGCYDAFIVNYPYLSKAFDCAPPGMLRILDMHDKFTGRRELLEKMGIEREFFYTNSYQEAIALRRADLVWAIKSEEAEFFRTLCDVPVMTVPHVEPSNSIERCSSSLERDQLVIGMVGARNSVNRLNAVLFLKEVLPIIESYLAPVKILFGGGMCADLANETLPPNVELFGRFRAASDFYSQIDAIVVPLAHSTGLKIKAVEAFALGMPVIAYAHAVEGIPVEHPYHQCRSSRELAEAVVDLAFQPELVETLRRATRETYRRLVLSANSALDQTVACIRERAEVILAVASMFQDRSSLYREQVMSHLHFLKSLGRPVFYFDRPVLGGFNTWIEAFHLMGSDIKVIFSPTAAEEMGLDGTSGSETFPIFYTIAHLNDYLQCANVCSVWMMDLPEEAITGTYNPPRRTLTYLRLEALRLLDIHDEQTVERAIVNNPTMRIVSSANLWEEPILLSKAKDHHFVRTPVWHPKVPWQMDGATIDDRVTLLAVPKTLDYAKRLWQALRNVVPNAPPARIVLPVKEDLALFAAPAERIMLDNARAVAQMKDFPSLIPLPRAVIDISEHSPAFFVLRETWQRKGVLWLSGQREQLLKGIARDRNPERPQTFLQLIYSILEGGEPSGLQEKIYGIYMNDVGWSVIWREISMQTQLYRSL